MVSLYHPGEYLYISIFEYIERASAVVNPFSAMAYKHKQLASAGFKTISPRPQILW